MRCGLDEGGRYVGNQVIRMVYYLGFFRFSDLEL